MEDIDSLIKTLNLSENESDNLRVYLLKSLLLKLVELTYSRLNEQEIKDLDTAGIENNPKFAFELLMKKYDENEWDSLIRFESDRILQDYLRIKINKN